jgi:hypothetical protein
LEQLCELYQLKVIKLQCGYLGCMRLAGSTKSLRAPLWLVRDVNASLASSENKVRKATTAESLPYGAQNGGVANAPNALKSADLLLNFAEVATLSAPPPRYTA